jgi:hypothetical protein
LSIQDEFVETDYSVGEIISAILSLGQYLGDTVVDAIIDDLALYGLLANNKDRFTISQIYIALERMFGDGASLLMRQITDALFRTQVAAT